MTSSRGEVVPPRGGTPPPAALAIRGEVVELAPLAREAAERHWEEFPEERERYGEAGLEWCAHDLQWVLAWAVVDAGGESGYLTTQLLWLRDLLSARDYPAQRLTRAVELLADVVGEHGDVARRLRAAGS